MKLIEFRNVRGQPNALEAFTQVTVAAVCPSAAIHRGRYGIDPGRGDVVVPDFFLMNPSFPERPNVMLEVTGTSLVSIESQPHHYKQKLHQTRVIYAYAAKHGGYKGLLLTGENYSSAIGYLKTLGVIQALFDGEINSAAAKQDVEKIARETPYVRSSLIDWNVFTQAILSTLGGF